MENRDHEAFNRGTLGGLGRGNFWDAGRGTFYILYDGEAAQTSFKPR